MKNIIMISSLILGLSTAYAGGQGCITGKPLREPSYVCYDGRSLQCGPTGYNWEAKRGCFLSRIPCCAYQATHYGYYPHARNITKALDSCQEKWPFHLGEFQTH